VGEPLGGAVHPEAGPDPVHVQLDRARVDADVGRDPVAVLGGEVQRDLGDLVEQIQVRRQVGDGAVDEDHVLDEQHQLLGHPSPEAQQRLDDLLHLAHQLLARQGERVDEGLLQLQLPGHGRQVGIARQRAQVPQRGELGHDVVDRAAHQQAEERQALGLVQPAGDAEVEQGRPPVG
jgi:hypothetical protein